jgi:hypothetical protein
VPQDITGVDIAKGWIDTFTLSSGKHDRIVMTKPALAVVDVSGGDAGR